MSEVVSKVGIHCVGPSRNGYGAFLQRIAAAGRRLSVVKCRDDFGAIDEPLALWPETLCVGAFTDYDRLPFDPVKFLARAALNPRVKIWEVLNEEDAPSTYSVKADLYITLAPLFAANGLSLCMFNCGSGNPPYPEEDGGQSYNEIMRACKFMLAHGYPAYLGLHEYAAPSDTIGRFAVLADYLEANNALLPIIVTEWGFETHIDDSLFMDFIEAADPIYMADKRVLGCATWTLGGGGWGASNFQTALPALADYIATVAPIVPPPPPPTTRIFQCWWDDDNKTVISTENPYNLRVDRDYHITAMTQPRTHRVNVANDGFGTATGGGVYNYGSDAPLEWKP